MPAVPSLPTDSTPFPSALLSPFLTAPSSGSGGVFLFDTASSPPTFSLLVLDQVGAAYGCAALDPLTQDLLLGRPDALYFYSEHDGRKGALGFQIHQRLAALGPPPSSNPSSSSSSSSFSSSSSSSSSSVLVASRDEVSGRTTLHIYDLKNKFVAFHTTLAPDQKVLALLSHRSLAYVLTSQGLVLRLREKTTAAKLKLLVQDMKVGTPCLSRLFLFVPFSRPVGLKPSRTRPEALLAMLPSSHSPSCVPHPHPSLALPTSQLFPVAIKLAYSCNYPVAQIMEIYRRYADHLYEKKRAYDESVQQYIHTIGRQGEREERGREPSMTEGFLFVNPVVRG
jgi:hypothetical protein